MAVWAFSFISILITFAVFVLLNFITPAQASGSFTGGLHACRLTAITVDMTRDDALRKAYVIAVFLLYAALLYGYATPRGNPSCPGRSSPNGLIAFLGNANAKLHGYGVKRHSNPFQCDTPALLRNCVHEKSNTLGAEFQVVVGHIDERMESNTNDKDVVHSLPRGDVLIARVGVTTSDHEATELHKRLVESRRWREVRVLDTASRNRSQATLQRADVFKSTGGLSPMGDDVLRLVSVQVPSASHLDSVGTFHNDDVVVISLSWSDVSAWVTEQGYHNTSDVQAGIISVSSGREGIVHRTDDSIIGTLKWLLMRNAAPSVVVFHDCSRPMLADVEWWAQPWVPMHTQYDGDTANDCGMDADGTDAEVLWVPNGQDITLHRRTTLLCPAASHYRAIVLPNAMDVVVGNV